MNRYGMHSPRGGNYRRSSNRFNSDDAYQTSNDRFDRNFGYDYEGYNNQYDEYSRDEDYGMAYGSIDNRTRETGVRPRASSGRYAYGYGPSRQDTDYLYDYSHDEYPRRSSAYGERSSRNRYESEYDRDYNRDYNRPSQRYQSHANNYGLGFSSDYDRNDNDRFNYSRSWNEYDTHYQKDEGIMEKIGRFFGVGPKGYKRSDERIHEDASEALYHDPYVDASEIEVNVKDGVITLSGTVDNRWAKRQAEDCVERVTGVKDVINNIRVESANTTYTNTKASSARKDSTSARSSVQ